MTQQDSFNKIRFFPDVLDKAGSDTGALEVTVNVMEVYNHGLALFAAQDQEAANLKASRQSTAIRLATELSEFLARFPQDVPNQFIIDRAGFKVEQLPS
jgi:hypothetical protein